MSSTTVFNKKAINDFFEIYPKFIAQSYRGKRIHLVKDYKAAKSVPERLFLKNVLELNAQQMLRENRPCKSFLWTAEKDGHLVYLFGDSHIIIENDEDNSGFDDEISFFKSYFHQRVLKAFEESECMYVEIDSFRHMKESDDEISDEDLNAADEKEAFNDCISDFDFGTLDTTGLLDRLIIIKAGGYFKPNVIAEKTREFVKEMECFSSHMQGLKKAESMIKSSEQSSTEETLCAIEMVQVGDLESLNEGCHAMRPDLQEMTLFQRNPNFVQHVLASLAKREKAFFAPGAMHYVGEKGVICLLEQKGVKVTRVLLD